MPALLGCSTNDSVSCSVETNSSAAFLGDPRLNSKHSFVTMLQRGKEQLVGEGDQKLEGQRAVVRAMTTQVESLQRQVASLNSLQAANEALKSTVEVGGVHT